MKIRLTKHIIAVAATVILVSLLNALVEAAGGAPVGVVVTCNCDDLVGVRFCLDLREKIRASAGYELVQDSENVAAGMHAVCIDDNTAEMKGASSAVAVTITLTTKRSEGYLDTYILVVGRERAKEMAATALGDLDAAIERFRKRLEVRVASQGE